MKYTEIKQLVIIPLSFLFGLRPYLVISLLHQKRIAVYPYVGTPSGRTGEMHGKTVKLQNSLFVGHSGMQSCTDAPRPEVINVSTGLTGIYSPNNGHVGIVSSQFLSSLSDIVKKGLVHWSSDFSLGGGTFVRS